jgi:hypothetical protein
VILSTLLGLSLLQTQGIGEAEGYKPSKVKPLELARKADAALKKLSDAKAVIDFAVEMPNGKGQTQGFVKIRDADHVAVQFGRVRNILDVSVTPAIRNGDRAGILLDDGWVTAAPSKLAPMLLPSKGIVATWPWMGQQYAMCGLMNGSTPFAYYMSAALAASEDYKVQVFERAVKVEDTTYKTIRVVTTRTKSGEKKLGPYKVAMTFDMASALPVTMVSEAKSPRGKVKSLWNARWSGPEKFEDKVFKLP